MDNSIDSSRVILWQYDKAYRLLRLLQAKDDLANRAVGQVWDKFRAACFDIQSTTWLDDPAISEKDRYFGLWLWGGIIGVPRPKKADGSYISDDLYRRLLRARLFLYSSNGSLADLNRYCAYLFDIGEGSSHPGRKVVIEEHEDMTIGYKFNWSLSDDEEALITVDSDGDGKPDLLPHPTGVEESHSFGGVLSMYFGFGGFFSKDGYRLYLSPEAIWKTSVGEVKTEPYFTSAGIQYENYDEDKGYYFVGEDGTKHYALEEYSTLGCLDKDGDALTPLLTDVSAYQFAYYYETADGTRYATRDAYYRGEDGVYHQVFRDESGWYWIADDTIVEEELVNETGGCEATTIDLEPGDYRLIACGAGGEYLTQRFYVGGYSSKYTPERVLVAIAGGSSVMQDLVFRVDEATTAEYKVSYPVKFLPVFNDAAECTSYTMTEDTSEGEITSSVADKIHSSPTYFKLGDDKRIIFYPGESSGNEVISVDWFPTNGSGKVRNPNDCVVNRESSKFVTESGLGSTLGGGEYVEDPAFPIVTRNAIVPKTSVAMSTVSISAREGKKESIVDAYREAFFKSLPEGVSPTDGNGGSKPLPFPEGGSYETFDATNFGEPGMLKLYKRVHSGATKKYIENVQSLGVFDNSIFKKE